MDIDLGRDLIHLPVGRFAKSPVCPDSDQIPQRSELTRCANTRPAYPGLIRQGRAGESDRNGWEVGAKPAPALRLHQYRQVGERSKFFNFDTG
jgi:hypothetical protein